jgi:regulator of protease activity HflC (stomatin/prohibitin superfamily)
MSDSPDLASLLVIALIIFVAVLLIRWLRSAQGLFVTVYEWEYGLSYFDGRFDRILPPGRHFSWVPQRRVVYRLRRGDQLHTTAVTDVTSSDKLVYRLGATLTYRFADPRTAFEGSFLEKINLAATTALPRIAAARTLEALLSERPGLDSELLGLVGSPIAGCEIVAATISTVILPPEVRRLFSEVERARLEGAAALERARGEQAALRSLANSARMLKGNPELMNLRLLQSLSAKNKAALVLGSNALLPVSADADAPLADS